MGNITLEFQEQTCVRFVVPPERRFLSSCSPAARGRISMLVFRRPFHHHHPAELCSGRGLTMGCLLPISSGVFSSSFKNENRTGLQLGVRCADTYTYVLGTRDACCQTASCFRCMDTKKPLGLGTCAAIVGHLASAHIEVILWLALCSFAAKADRLLSTGLFSLFRRRAPLSGLVSDTQECVLTAVTPEF